MTPIETLLAAKAESDRRNYTRKHQLLRELMAKNPGQFVIDSDDGSGILGLTHVPTKFRIHAPASVPPVPLASAIKAAEALLDSVVADRAVRAAEELLKLAALPLPIPAPTPAGKAMQVANRMATRAAAPKPVPPPVPKPVPKPVPPVAAPKPVPAPAPVPAPPAPGALGTAARAPGNYVKSLTGYGEGGSLQGQKLFDSTSVKPRMYRAEYQKRLAEGARAEDLAKTHQLPGWIERLPGGGTLTQIGHTLNTNRFTHPFVQTFNTANNLLSTPLTRPLSNPASKALLDNGAANVARGGARGLLGRAQRAGGYTLKGIDAGLGAGTKALNYGSLGVGAAGLAHSTWMSPANAARRMVYSVPSTAQDRSVPEADAMERNPLPAIWDGLTDDSDVAEMQRQIGRRHLPYTVQNSAAHAVEQSKTNPFYATLHGLRRFTIGGNLTNGATAALADSTPAPTQQIVAEEAARAAPKILANYDANLRSPSGQRLIRVMEPVARDPGVPEAAVLLNDQNRVARGEPELWKDPNVQGGLSVARTGQPAVDLGDVLASAPARAAAPVAAPHVGHLLEAVR